jgi:hypothetical protein
MTKFGAGLCSNQVKREAEEEMQVKEYSRTNTLAMR